MMHPEWMMADLAFSMARVACPDKLKRKFRL